MREWGQSETIEKKLEYLIEYMGIVRDSKFDGVPDLSPFRDYEFRLGMCRTFLNYMDAVKKQFLNEFLKPEFLKNENRSPDTANSTNRD